jgi:small subunit ribosomal protein S13
MAQIAATIQDNYLIEGRLRHSMKADIERFVKIRSYRGTRHQSGLPCRGQRTRSNAKNSRVMAANRKAKFNLSFSLNIRQ